MPKIDYRLYFETVDTVFWIFLNVFIKAYQLYNYKKYNIYP